MGRRPRGTARTVDSAVSSRLTANELLVGDEMLDLHSDSPHCVVGAGKASARWRSHWKRRSASSRRGKASRRLGQCAGRLRRADAMRPFARGPAGGRQRAAAGRRRRARSEFWRSCRRSAASDVCFCLLSGGGSALLPAPAPGITLDDKIRVTRIIERRRGKHRATQHRPDPAESGEGRRARAGVPRRPFDLA